MTLDEIKSALTNFNIELKALHEHGKASEKYLSVIFRYPDSDANWEGWIPYHYRRAGLEINEPAELAQLLETVYIACSLAARTAWVQLERERWEREYKGKIITKPFFDKLLNLQWNCVESDLPRNPNPQRRIQDIKEAGYLVATNTNRYCLDCQKKTTQLLLVPHQKSLETGYEVFSPAFRRRIIKLLGSINVYEARVTPSNALIPDHKFPEIRWDLQIRSQNLDTMSDAEIKAKFQLLDNQRNLQKREVCRHCYQTGKRGKLFGLEYYYQGDEEWPSNVVKRGKEAEAGCVGCPWYDLQKWRENLNAFLAGDAL